MRFKSVFTVAALALIGVGASLLAQQQPGQPGQPGGRGRGGPPGGFGGFGGGGFGQSRMSLLRIGEVKKELELADEQVAALEKIDQELREKYPFGGRGGPGGPGGKGGDGKGGDGKRGPGRGGDNNRTSLETPATWYFVQAQAQPGQNQPGQNQPGQGRGRGGFPQMTDEQRAEFEKQRLERSREERAKIAEVLLPHQLKRLTEIYVQQAGVGALQDEDIAKELGISDAQKAKLAAVRQANQEAMGAQMRELFQGGGGGDRDAARAKMDEMRKAGDAKVLAVLSADQQKKFEELKGKPFEMPEGAGRGGPGGGPPGGNRGRGTRGGNNN